jgi:23S rRNA (guanosine2251-2'-O)-methyltransferase
MSQMIHQIRKCLKPTCGFRFPNHLFSEQYVFCPKCGSPTDIVEIPYAGMVGQNKDTTITTHLEVLLDNIRSAHNVGSIIRTSDGIGISHIHFCGITPTPDNEKVKKTALSAEQFIPWTQYWNAIEAGEKLVSDGYILVALEGGEGSVSIFDYIHQPPSQSVILVVGNEISGVDPGLLAICQNKIWLPMLGTKQSFNVSVAFGIASYILRFSDLV